MSDFVQNLLHRHLAPADSVQPRLRGKFEPSPLASEMPMHGFGEHDERPEQPAMQVPPAIPDPAAQPLPGVFRQFANPLSERAGAENLPVSISPITAALPLSLSPTATAVQPSALTIPSLKASDAFSEKPAIFPSEALGEWRRQSLELGNEQSSAPNQPLNGSPEKPLPPSSSNIQPAFGMAEKPLPPLKGLLRPNGEGGTGRLPEALRQRLRMEAQPSPPVIKVSIGRIEVRASVQAAPAARPSGARAGAQPRLTLEEYLKKQNGAPR